MNVEQNTSFCEPTPFYPPTPTLFDASTASTEDHRTDEDVYVLRKLFSNLNFEFKAHLQMYKQRMQKRSVSLGVQNEFMQDWNCDKK